MRNITFFQMKSIFMEINRFNLVNECKRVISYANWIKFMDKVLTLSNFAQHGKQNLIWRAWLIGINTQNKKQIG
jgi:hypothetical protein